jgi:hypothetical protein
MAPRIGLSTVSVYPESSAHAFGYAASLGYDAVEVMVGIDALSQQTSAVKQLSEHHGIPITAVHAPCLLFTQRVWGTERGASSSASAEMAHAVGAEGGRRAPARSAGRRSTRATSSTASRPSRSQTASRSPVANMYPWRASSRRRHGDCTCRLGPLRAVPYANTTVDLSHAAIAQSDRSRWPNASATGCGTHPLTATSRQRVGQGRDPSPVREMGAASFCGTWPRPGSTAR